LSPQLLRQHRSATIQAGAYRPHRAFQYDCRILISRLFQIAQHHRLAVYRGETQHGSPDLFHGFAANQISQRIILYDGIFVRKDFLAAAEPLQNTVARHSEQERGQRTSRGIEAEPACEQRQENFLGDILGRHEVSGHVEGKAVNRPLSATVEQSESQLVAFTEPLKEFFVGLTGLRGYFKSHHAPFTTVFKCFCFLLAAGNRISSRNYGQSFGRETKVLFFQSTVFWNANCSIGGMNWRQVENHWQEFRSFAKKRWHRLTDDDLNGIAGQRVALVKSLMLRYKMTAGEADRCADQWLRLSQDADTVEMRPTAVLTSQAS
jgi:hypothetical protein